MVRPDGGEENAGPPMNDLSVDGWDNRLDAERSRMEIVKLFEAFILTNTIETEEH